MSFLSVFQFFAFIHLLPFIIVLYCVPLRCLSTLSRLSWHCTVGFLSWIWFFQSVLIFLVLALSLLLPLISSTAILPLLYCIAGYLSRIRSFSKFSIFLGTLFQVYHVPFLLTSFAFSPSISIFFLFFTFLQDGFLFDNLFFLAFLSATTIVTTTVGVKTTTSTIFHLL